MNNESDFALSINEQKNNSDAKLLNQQDINMLSSSTSKKTLKSKKSLRFDPEPPKVSFYSRDSNSSRGSEVNNEKDKEKS